MKLMRVGAVGAERPVVLAGDATFDATPVTADFDGDFFAADGLVELQAAYEAGSLPRIDVTGLRIGPPIARPGAVLCIGQNYALHAAESGSEPPAAPILFFKSPNTVVGPDDDVIIPRSSHKTDWEVELGVVIGKRARYLDSVDDGLSYVAGYLVANDVSERGFQLNTPGGQWGLGKSCETFNPIGPWLVTAEDIPDPQKLQLRSWVNDQPRQDSSTADMIFPVAYLIWFLSQYLVLEPGDLINTGTPQGVALSGRFPYLLPGDVMVLEIEGLGRQRQLLKPERSVASRGSRRS